MAVLQVDGNMMVGVKSFLDQEEQESKSPTSNLRMLLQQVLISFYGIDISLSCNQSAKITQGDKIDRIYLRTVDK